MSSQYQNAQRTRALLLQHFQAYPALQAEDIFKFRPHPVSGGGLKNFRFAVCPADPESASWSG